MHVLACGFANLVEMTSQLHVYGHFADTLELGSIDASIFGDLHQTLQAPGVEEESAY